MHIASNARQPSGARTSGTQRVYDALRSEIMMLSLAPSTALDEVSLSERFALSRTPVREALVRLASEGLVVSLPNRGTIVAPLELARTTAYFDALTLLQRATTRLAARNHLPEELPALHELRLGFEDAVDRTDVVAMIDLNRDFHVKLSESGRNAYYTEFYTRLLDEGKRLSRLYYASFHDHLPLAFAKEHDALLDAVAARDEARADALAAAHARQVMRQIQSLFEAGLGSDLPLEAAS